MKELTRKIRGRTFSVGEVCWYRCMRLKFPRSRRLVVIKGFSKKEQDVIVFSTVGCIGEHRGNADWFRKRLTPWPSGIDAPNPQSPPETDSSSMLATDTRP